MNEKEISELRRRLRPEKNAITRIRGCYVNGEREIISSFSQSFALMPEDEADKFLGIFRRTLSGGLGRNLMDLSFRTAQVAGSPEHSLLCTLRDSGLDEEAAEQLFQKIIPTVSIEGSFVILLMRDAYDVPFRGKDGRSLEDASTEQFTYILCSICPVRLTKPVLRYDAAESVFHNRAVDNVIAPPELGFLFPAFDSRATNLYGALYYTHSLVQTQEDFLQAIFQLEPPMPAQVQQETFHTVLSSALEEDCSMELVQAVHGQLCGILEEHKANHDPEPPSLTRGEMRYVLEANGVSQSHAQAFDRAFREEFGDDAALPPRNLVEPRQFEIRTENAVLRVDPDRRDLVETRILNGVPYVLLRAEDGVQVNGISIQITGDGPAPQA